MITKLLTTIILLAAVLLPVPAKYLTYEQGVAIARNQGSDLYVSKNQTEEQQKTWKKQADTNGDVFCVVERTDQRFPDGISIITFVKRENP